MKKSLDKHKMEYEPHDNNPKRPNRFRRVVNVGMGVGGLLVALNKLRKVIRKK